MQLMNRVRLEQAIDDFHFVKQENVIQEYHDWIIKVYLDDLNKVHLNFKKLFVKLTL